MKVKSMTFEFRDFDRLCVGQQLGFKRKATRMELRDWILEAFNEAKERAIREYEPEGVA